MNNTDDLNTLRDLMQTGKVTPVIDRQYSLSEAPTAIRYLTVSHGVRTGISGGLLLNGGFREVIPALSARGSEVAIKLTGPTVRGIMLLLQ